TRCPNPSRRGSSGTATRRPPGRAGARGDASKTRTPRSGAACPGPRPRSGPDRRGRGRCSPPDGGSRSGTRRRGGRPPRGSRRPEETREQCRELLVVLRLELEGDRCVHGPPDVRQEDEEDDPEDGEDVAHFHGFPEGVPPIPSREGAVGPTHPGEVRPTEDLVDR